MSSEEWANQTLMKVNNCGITKAQTAVDLAGPNRGVLPHCQATPKQGKKQGQVSHEVVHELVGLQVLDIKELHGRVCVQFIC